MLIVVTPVLFPRLPSSVCLFGCLWCAGARVCHRRNMHNQQANPKSPPILYTSTILRRLNVFELEQTGVSSQNVDFSRTALASRGNLSPTATLPFLFFPSHFFFYLLFSHSFFPNHHRWKRGCLSRFEDYATNPDDPQLCTRPNSNCLDVLLWTRVFSFSSPFFAPLHFSNHFAAHPCASRFFQHHSH